MTLAGDITRALDPVSLAERIGMTPDSWQADVLRSDAQRIILNCARQSGKSTVAAILAMHTAIYKPGSLVLVLSPTERQSKELFRRCLVIYRSLGRPVSAEAENRLSLELENHSRIVSLPGSASTIRGFSGVGLLIVDEAAQVEDDTFYTVLPMLAVSGGRLLLLSTPFGRRGFFFEVWRSSDDWERVTVPADECPRISAAALEEAKRSMGEWWFDQEYLCRFLDAQTQAFGLEEIEAAFDKELEPWTI